jgi:Tfp pilus assembly protein PilF
VRLFAICFLLSVIGFFLWPADCLAAPGKFWNSQGAGTGGSPFSDTGKAQVGQTYGRTLREYTKRTNRAGQTGDNVVAAGGSQKSSGFKAGVDKFLESFKPEPVVKEAADPLNLSTPAKPSAELHAAMARLAEQQGNPLQAENQYRKALDLEPKHVGTLVSYARLKSRQGRQDEAIALYKRAADAAPDDASIHNDLGLCFARRRMWKESLAALGRAVQLDPDNSRYRNNIATVLVDLGQMDQARGHLATVHGEAVADYNLGYMMQKKGDRRAAMAYFTRAIQRDPNLQPAKQWLEHLASQADSTPRPDSYAGNGPQGARVGKELPADRDSPQASPRYAHRPAAPPFVREAPPQRTLLPEQRNLPPVHNQQRGDLSSSNGAPLPPPLTLSPHRGSGTSHRTETPRVNPMPPSVPIPPNPAGGKLPTRTETAPMPPDMHYLPPVR